MRQPSWSRLRRQVVWAGAVALGAASLPVTAMTTAHASSVATVAAHASAHATKGATRIRGFDHETATTKVGSVVTDRVVVLPRARRTVVVQVRRPGAAGFVTQSTGHSTASGAFTASYAPTSAGTWRFRLAVRPTAHRKAVTSGVRIVTATAQASVTGLELTALTRTSLSLAWVKGQPAVTCFLVGARNPEELAWNIPVDDVTLTEDVIAQLSAITDPVKDKLGTNPDMWVVPGRMR